MAASRNAKQKTGEEIPLTELFTCNREEILDKLMEIADLKKYAPIEEMKQAFKPEYVVFYPEYLEITFPEDTLPEFGSPISIMRFHHAVAPPYLRLSFMANR